MDLARLECWVNNDGFWAQNAPRWDSELTAREHAMKYGDWTGTYQSKIQRPLAPSAEPSRPPATTLSQEEGIDHGRSSLEHSHDPSLVEIIGEFNTEVKMDAPENSIYIGPRPSLELRYPPDLTRDRCYTYSDIGDIRDHRLEIQVRDALHLPGGDTRPITDDELDDIAAGLAHKQPGPEGHFGPRDVKTLETGLMGSLDNLYLGYDQKSNYAFTRNTDPWTGRRVVIATKKGPDQHGHTYSVELRSFQEPSHTSAHPLTSSRAPLSSQRK
jgi:hypothetical protein